jgi:protein-tyrosine-phosphatase/DNA-binding transcriptional ArsR family regulator
MKRVSTINRRGPSLPTDMDSSDVVAILAALAQPWRLATFRLLTRYLPYGLAAGDIARLIALSHNSLSTHLAILKQAGLVRSRREGRSIIFIAVRERALQLAAFLTDDCCGATGPACGPWDAASSNQFPTKREVTVSDKLYNVLILCTGNSARSILAEALLNKEGQGRFRAYSAGSHPKPNPSPYTLDLLRELGYEIAGLRSKSWEDFVGPDAPRMDFILTVCDAAAGEACAYWPGHPLVAHWGIPDPATVRGTDAEERAAFMETYRRLSSRITAFVNLDVEKLDLSTLKRKLADIGAMEGATEMALQRKAA